MGLPPAEGESIVPLQLLCEADLDRYLSISRRYGRPLSILLSEIDALKPATGVADQGGALKLRRLVGEKLLQSKRAADAAGTAHSGEFLLILPETDLGAAQLVAERLNRAISGAVCPLTGQAVTLSTGVNQCNPEVEAADCLAAAHFWLMRAKAAGGNRSASCLDDTTLSYPISL